MSVLYIFKDFGPAWSGHMSFMLGEGSTPRPNNGPGTGPVLKFYHSKWQYKDTLKLQIKCSILLLVQSYAKSPA